MKCVTFDGLGAWAFHDARFGPDGASRGHPFDDPRFAGAGILVVNKNFGCGSSREHAPQALQKAGIRAIIGESFAEIFAGNCTAMGIPAVRAGADNVEALQALLELAPETMVTIDLVKGRITALPGQAVRRGARDGLSFALDMAPAFRNSLVDGSWDSTGVLLENRELTGATARRLPYMTGFA
jgi:3-isopropylmalate/(R)-2-methylmalate dehydratase small subunit